MQNAPLAIGNVQEFVGPVKVPIVVFVPARVSAEGVMLVNGLPVLFVTFMAKVAVSPEKWQVAAAYGPVIVIWTLSGLTLSVFDDALRDVTEAPARTSVTPYLTVPLSLLTVLHV